MREVKDIVNSELKKILTEAVKIDFGGQKYILKVSTNEDPQKNGVKIQFQPMSITGASSTKQEETAMKLQNILNDSMSKYGLTIERDRQIRDKSIIAFFMYIEYFEKMIVDALKGMEQE